VEISEIDINTIQREQSVTLVLDAVPNRTYEGRVTGVGLAGVDVQGVVSFPVSVEVSEPDQAIRPGMTAAVNIVVQQIEDALLVPNRAVRLRDGERVVYVLRPDNPLPQPVEILLGASSDLNSQVLEGDLQVGDLIVINPPLESGAGGQFFGGS
jgi:HlyD family secretion protein